MLSATLYEIMGISTFVIILIWLIRFWRMEREKANPLISILMVGLFFGIVWEPQGTGPVWTYHGFNLYTFAGIPLMIILNWSWVMIVCHLISGYIMRVFESFQSIRGHWLVSKASIFLSGALIASVAEPLFTFLGPYQYHFLGDKAVLTFPFLNVQLNLTVIVGWGMLTTINLTFSKIAESLAIKLKNISRLSYTTALVASSSLLGAMSGWLSWQLSILFATVVENIEPRIFFTREYIIVLDWITSAQLATILILSTACTAYVWRQKRNRITV